MRAEQNAMVMAGGPRGGDDCCAFLIEPRPGAAGPAAAVRFCGMPCLPGSAYCPEHHVACHIAPGSHSEHRKLREIEALATAVGGKQGRVTRDPPKTLLRRLGRIERNFSHD